jgi:hypothetical protein
MRKKIPDWRRHARIVAEARAAAQKLNRGLTLSPREWQDLPDYVHPALKAIEAKQSRRLGPPYRPDMRRWFARLVREFVLTTEVDLRDYKSCFDLSLGVFTDASFEAAKRKFKAFPAPGPLRKFLIDWGEEHRPSNLPDKDRRHQSLFLTDADRRRLLNAEVGKGLTERHVRIAHTLASRPCGQPSHEQVAKAACTSVRTVRRALPALRALGLLSEGRRNLLRIKLSKQVRGFQPALIAIAARAGCSTKTLYRWELETRRKRSN